MGYYVKGIIPVASLVAQGLAPGYGKCNYLIAFKPIVDLAKSLLDAVGSGKVREQAVKLYGEILAAQESAMASNLAQATLVEEKRRLEQRVAELETWDRDKEQYELKEVVRGVFAYQRKTDANSSEPPHFICANCYEERRKSLLQRRPLDYRTIALACPRCSATFMIHAAGVQYVTGGINPNEL